MFNGFTNLKNAPGTDFGERMLNKVASESIRRLFSKSESVEVSIRCSPSSKLLQGSLDSFKMGGCGLLIRKDFWVEEMRFETDAVALDFGSVLSGKIRLKQPTQAIAQITLTEEGINEAFKSELVVKRLQNVTEPALMNLSGGEPVSFSDIALKLLPENRIQIFAKALLPNNTLPVSMTATLAIDRRRRVAFQNPQFEPEAVPEELRGISEVLTMAFAEILDNMVDLDRFDLNGVLLRINRLETQGNHLIFSGYAQIEQFPNVA